MNSVRALAHTSRALGTVLLLSGVGLTTSAPAQAKGTFDGTWSVLIMTEKGSCDRAYRYPVQISNGRVGYAGEAGFSVSGRVSENGAVTVRVSRGQQSANGSGKLSRTSGGGAWRGGECSGRWTAERR